jgi:adenylate kinase
MILIFLGLPGSGKGTQAQTLVQNYGFKQLSTGELIRHEIAAETELGQQIKATVESGAYTTDDVILKLVQHELDYKENYILDGFPRTKHQAVMLDQMLKEADAAVTGVITFQIDDQTVIKRLSGRYSCDNCGQIYNRYFAQPKVEGKCDSCQGTIFKARADDKEESVIKRLKVYHELTEPLEEYYRAQGISRTVNANQPPEQVALQLISVLQESRWLPAKDVYI